MEKEEFYKKIPIWISEPKEKWNHITLLAYFCYKYEKKNGVRFSLSNWKVNPGKSKESRDFARLFSEFSPHNYSLLPLDEKLEARVKTNKKIYNYINWMFDFKFRSGEKSVTGTGIFLLKAIINEFERMYISFLKKEKVKDVFNNFCTWCEKEEPEIFNLQQLNNIEDLLVLSRYIEMYSLGESDVEYRAVKKAKDMGLL